ncbi:Rieske (2Fe-2S) protein [Martelella soudanensis]|uniref:Rieske (2Fe-2S) protein n=1 Tax=unclassified Martelella TaxID=2629616 RepID=UPI0015DE162E|nr:MULTISPECIES: Rieske (2Fe-2S) protein [unclassified Martelella]
MHPQTTGRWTPAALSADLTAGTAMPVNLAAGTIALWRSASGRLSASDDRCPHRGMRLSHGFVRGEKLSCIYHGWSYGQDGQCLRIPAHPDLTPPKTIRVETYPVVEQDGVIWVADGNEPDAPPRLEGFTPLRSLNVHAGIAAIERAAGAKADADGILKSAGETLRLLLSDHGNDETLMHVLVSREATPAERIAASREAEALRRKAEAAGIEGGKS